ncbi:MAG: nucleotide exchange factor GrpE [Alphaproteobacteria bacterium]|nr:nucleotide exchange factor GrpE [Alphaproteobacteria bacterium]
MTDPQSEKAENEKKKEAPEAAQKAAKEPEAPTVTPEARIAELEKQLAEAKDRILREMADAENTRRRAQKDREDSRKFAIAEFSKEMLGISDNFNRALDAAPKNSADPTVKNLIAGVDAIERQLQAALEKFGIKKLDSLDKPFDPNFHRVMSEVDAPGKPAGTVVQVLQAGYTIHGRLLREALVAVAKGGASSEGCVDTSA